LTIYGKEAPHCGASFSQSSGRICLCERQFEHHEVVLVLEFEREPGIVHFAISCIIVHTEHHERGYFVADKPTLQVINDAIDFLRDETLQLFTPEGLTLTAYFVWRETALGSTAPICL
jgi:hypothetical protein